MNLKSRKVRLPIAALGACALVTGGGVLTAGSAFAAGETLSFVGATGNAASIVAVNPQPVPAATYGVRVAGLPGGTPIELQMISAPTSSILFAERIATGGVPAADASFSTTTLSSSALSTVGTAAAGATSVTTGAAPSASIPSGTLVRLGTQPSETYVTSGATTTTTMNLTTPLRTAVTAGSTLYGAASGSTYFQRVSTTNYGGILQSYAGGDNLYLGADTAGTYTFRVFSDVNGDGVYQANTDDSTPVFTLTAKSAADAFALNAPSSVTAGTTGAKATVTPSIDVTDIRGGSPSSLGTGIAGALAVAVTDNGSGTDLTKATNATTSTSQNQLGFATAAAWSTGDIIENGTNQYIGTVASGGSTATVTLTANAAVAVGNGDTLHSSGKGVSGETTSPGVTYSTADGFYRYLTADASTTPLRLGPGTPHTLGTALSFNSTAVSGATKTVEVTSNNVSALGLAVKAGQTANVLTGSGTAQVRVGTADVTYTATATDSDGAVLAGKDVIFTLTGTSGTTASTDLKANGAAVASNGQVTVATGSDGVATLKVTSTKTDATNAYSVAAASGTQSGATITSTYFATAPYLVTSSNVAALVGGSAVVSGKVVDRWSQPYSSSGLTAGLAVSGGATPASGNYPIGSDGKFSATLTDTASNTTPRTDTFTWTVSGATTQAGSKSLAWRTSITPGAVGVATTTIAGSSTDTAIPFTSSTTKVDLATSGAFTGDVETVKGTITDTATTPAALPFASVTYTGSDGVYFYDSDNKLSKTMTAVTTSTGKISYDGSADGIRVLFTKAGDATITAKAGAVTKTVTVPVEVATDAYKVIAIDVNGRPGTTITVQGKVADAFENPASGRKVTLALSSLSAGNFSGTDADTGNAGFQVVTDETGVWSTPFTSTSNQDGSVVVTATLWNAGNSAVLTASPTANAAYATAGVTVPAGEYQDTATIKIGVEPLTLSSSGKLTYGSKYYARGALISGTGAGANADVDIYAKVPGGTYALIDSIKADDQGEFGAKERISKSTYFLAKSGGSTSSASPTRIYSKVILTAQSGPRGHVTLSANGGPNAKAYLYFYRVFSNGDTDYLGKKVSNSSANGSAVFKAPSGKRIYKVLFRSPGTTTGSDTVHITVQ